MKLTKTQREMYQQGNETLDNLWDIVRAEAENDRERIEMLGKILDVQREILKILYPIYVK